MSHTILNMKNNFLFDFSSQCVKNRTVEGDSNWTDAQFQARRKSIQKSLNSPFRIKKWTIRIGPFDDLAKQFSVRLVRIERSIMFIFTNSKLTEIVWEKTIETYENAEFVDKTRSVGKKVLVNVSSFLLMPWKRVLKLNSI